MEQQAQLNEIDEAIKKTKEKRMYERLLAVKLRLTGHSFTEIGRLLGRQVETISNYWHAYQQTGLQGLQMKYAPGRPPALTEDQQQQLADLLVQKRPADVGFEARYTWTLALIASWIEREFGQSYTPKGVSKMLHRLGFSFTKATYTLERANESEQQEFREKTFPQLKHQLLEGKIDHLLFEDESMIRAYQALQYNWFPKGEQRKIPTYGRHEGAKLFGAINYETGQMHHREEETADTAAFQRFLEDLLSTYAKGRIVLILDNSKIHHADELAAFLQKHKRLEFVFLPAYSPKLNLIEGVWKWLKSDVVNNVFFSKFYHIKIHVRSFMRRLNNNPQTTIDRLLVRF